MQYLANSGPKFSVQFLLAIFGDKYNMVFSILAFWEELPILFLTGSVEPVRVLHQRLGVYIKTKLLNLL